MQLSIIVPVYNGENYLENCVKSILTQNHNDFELIIINDGSKDNTKTICDKIEKLDSRIKVLHSKNEGVSKTRNKGLELAAGKYVTFVDCDDKISNDIYVDMLKQMEENNLDLALCSYTSEFNDHSEDNLFSWDDRIFENDEIKKNITVNTISRVNEDGSYNNVVMGSVCRGIFKKDIINDNNIRFADDITFAEDLVFLIEYLDKCKKVFTTNKCYYFYNRRTNLQLSTTQKYIKGLEQNFERVDNRILEVINIEKFEETKVWALRKVTNVYTLSVNASLNRDGITNKQKVQEIKDIVRKNNFKYYLTKLNNNEFYGLNKLATLCLKFKLYSVFVKKYAR